jgi:predicted Zn-dependent protease
VSRLQNEAQQTVSRLQNEQKSLSLKFNRLAYKAKLLSSVRKRFKAFTKNLIRSLRTENTELKLNFKDLLTETQRTQGQAELKAKTYQETVTKLSQEIRSMHECFDNERSQFEEKFKAHFEKVKTFYNEKLKLLAVEKDRQLAAINFENQQEYSRVLESSVKFQRLSEELTAKLNNERAQKNATQNTEIRDLMDKNIKLQAELESGLTAISRRESELQDQFVQKSEEVRELKAQIKEKSEQLVQTELELHRSRPRSTMDL